MKSTGTFSEIRQLHAKYQNRTLAIDEEIEALKREKAEMSMACDVVYAIYRTAFQHENAADVDVLHGFMKASLAELDHIRKTEFRNNLPLPDSEGRERASATPVSRCVDPALWTLFAMKIREENGPSLEERIARMMIEHVTRNAFIVERTIDEYEYTCKVVWETCGLEADFDAAVAK